MVEAEIGIGRAATEKAKDTARRALGRRATSICTTRLQMAEKSAGSGTHSTNDADSIVAVSINASCASETILRTHVPRARNPARTLPETVKRMSDLRRGRVTLWARQKLRMPERQFWNRTKSCTCFQDATGRPHLQEMWKDWLERPDGRSQWLKWILSLERSMISPNTRSDRCG